MKSRRQDTRSEDHEKDSNEKLRAENRKLRKQVSQLQSENNRLRNLTTDEWSDQEPIIPESIPTDKCPKCKTEVKIVAAGIFDVKVCENCGWKKRKKIDLENKVE